MEPQDELFLFKTGSRTRCVTASTLIAAGQTGTILEIEGTGILRRLWLTSDIPLDHRLHRSLRVRFFWDGEDVPAANVPFGDFFGHVLGDLEFENEFFSAPSIRSYNCFIPMPFRRGARFEITNESQTPVRIYYEINWQELDHLDDEALYFHAYWRREERTVPGKDFVLLPALEGRGRYLGTHCAVVTEPLVPGSWSEGDYRVFVDGNTDAAVHSLAADDQIGCAWGQSKTFLHRAYGRWEARLYREGDQGGNHSFYRYHLADPVYFQKEIRVLTSVMGGLPAGDLARLVRDRPGVKDKIALPEGMTWADVNAAAAKLAPPYIDFFRSDDWTATTFLYLDRPKSR